MDEAVEAPAVEAAAEPRMTLIEAIDLGRAHAASLSVAGATEGIRYAAKRAAEMSFRLMRELETHRRYTGGEHI